MGFLNRINTNQYIGKFEQIYNELSNDKEYGNLIENKNKRGDDGQVATLDYDKRLTELLNVYFKEVSILKKKGIRNQYSSYEDRRYFKEIEIKRNATKQSESQNNVQK